MRGGGTGNADTLEEGRGLEKGANEWIPSNKETMDVVRLVDADSWVKVKYEDNCNDTAATLDHLFHFLCGDPTRKRLDFRTVDHHVLGNGMRLDASDTIVLDERWRDEFTDSDLAIIDRIAGKMNREFGYN